MCAIENRSGPRATHMGRRCGCVARVGVFIAGSVLASSAARALDCNAAAAPGRVMVRFKSGIAAAAQNDAHTAAGAMEVLVGFTAVEGLQLVCSAWQVGFSRPVFATSFNWCDAPLPFSSSLEPASAGRTNPHSSPNCSTTGPASASPKALTSPLPTTPSPSRSTAKQAPPGSEVPKQFCR